MEALTTLDRSALDAYDALLMPAWLFSADTLQILASNETARQWLGYDAHTLHSMTVADLRPPNERPGIRQQVEHFDGATADAGTWSITDGPGVCRTASVGWTKVLFEGSPAIVASVRDITQTMQARSAAQSLSADLEALEKKGVLQSEHFASLFNAVPGKMLVLTPGNYTIVAATDEYAAAVNAGRESLVGTPLFQAFPDNPDEPEADGTRNLRASLQRVEALRTTDVMNVQRYPVRAPDGHFQERFWLPLNKPVFDNAGQLLFIIHRVEDVTSALTGNNEHGTDTGRTGEAARPALESFAETRATFLALQERETRLRTAESLLQIGAWEFDPTTGNFQLV